MILKKENESSQKMAEKQLNQFSLYVNVNFDRDFSYCLGIFATFCQFETGNDSLSSSLDVYRCERTSDCNLGGANVGELEPK